MADAESIKRAMRALEDEMGWADNLARCFVAAAGDHQGLAEPPWINQFSRVIDQLGVRVNDLVMAIHAARE